MKRPEGRIWVSVQTQGLLLLTNLRGEVEASIEVTNITDQISPRDDPSQEVRRTSNVSIVTSQDITREIVGCGRKSRERIKAMTQMRIPLLQQQMVR